MSTSESLQTCWPDHHEHLLRIVFAQHSGPSTATQAVTPHHHSPACLPCCVSTLAVPAPLGAHHPHQILFWKKRAEEALQRSGLKHTIVRPGGLKSRLGPGETTAGNIVMGRAGSYGFPPLQKSGSILRSQVGSTWVHHVAGCMKSRFQQLCGVPACAMTSSSSSTPFDFTVLLLVWLFQQYLYHTVTPYSQPLP